MKKIIILTILAIVLVLGTTVMLNINEKNRNVSEAKKTAESTIEESGNTYKNETGFSGIDMEVSNSEEKEETPSTEISPTEGKGFITNKETTPEQIGNKGNIGGGIRYNTDIGDELIPPPVNSSVEY